MIFAEKEEFEKLTATPAKTVKRYVRKKRHKHAFSLVKVKKEHNNHCRTLEGNGYLYLICIRIYNEKEINAFIKRKYGLNNF